MPRSTHARRAHPQRYTPTDPALQPVLNPTLFSPPSRLGWPLGRLLGAYESAEPKRVLTSAKHMCRRRKRLRWRLRQRQRTQHHSLWPGSGCLPKGKPALKIELHRAVL